MPDSIVSGFLEFDVLDASELFELIRTSARS